MAIVHLFVSFDLDHDNDCKLQLISELTRDGSRFAVDDWSIREIAADWQDKAKKRISSVDLMLVICGEHSDAAPNVNNEIGLARSLGVPYLLLDGRPGLSTRPAAALEGDRLLDWIRESTWPRVVSEMSQANELRPDALSACHSWRLGGAVG